MKVHIGPYRKNRSVKVHIDEYDVWNMDYTLALIILPMLKKLKEIGHGYPSEFSEPDIREDGINYGGNGGGAEAWDKVLDQMIEGFEVIVTDDTWPSVSVSKLEKVQHALYLFAHFYMNLWD